MEYIKKCVSNLNNYIVNQNYTVAKLNQNESPYDIPLEIKKKISELVVKINWNRYPDSECSKLKDYLSDYVGHTPSGIAIGNSSNEMINMVYSSVCTKGDKVVTITPGFTVFSRIAQIMELNLSEVPLNEDFSYNIEKIIEESKNAKLLIFASPNNPTGTYLSIDNVERILKNVKCIFALDEAYFEFHGETALKLIKKYRNLVIIRTFSKAFSLAGLRIGYILGKQNIINEMTKAKMPFSVDHFSQIAGIEILKNTQIIYKNVSKVIYERNRLYKLLKEIPGIVPIESKTNFIMIKLENYSTKEIEAKIIDKGILIRRFEGFMLEDKLRVTVGLPHENDSLIEVLRKIIR